MDKYLCWYCEGEGETEIHSVEGNFIRECEVCGGSGKRNITITLEEYDSLKRPAKEIKQLTDAEELALGIC